MAELQFTTDVAAPADAVFAAIADLTGYGRWLPGSNSFGGITNVSPLPVGLGTTYIDAGPAGTREGSIVAFTPPTLIAFRQPMRVQRGMLMGTIDIDVRCALEPLERGTRVVRTITIRPRGLLLLAQPLIVSAFRAENERLLAELRRYVESQEDVTETPSVGRLDHRR
jgi:uncharacterized protein YndB with AHSA1/START domain